MFDKFKLMIEKSQEMILGTFAEGMARENIRVKEIFRVRSPEEIAAANEEVNAMMRQPPEKIIAEFERINSGLHSNEDKINEEKAKTIKRKEDEEIKIETAKIKQEISELSREDKREIVLDIFKTRVLDKIVDSALAIRDKASKKTDDLKDGFNGFKLGK